MGNIDFGIDLGTTNSAISKYENGKIQILKNPIGFREVLPSVVSFRKGRMLIGDKAREQYLSNAGNVFSAFKRKIGTNDVYLITEEDSIREVSPIELSSYVLSELKNFVQGEPFASVVITIPASFDTIQSNATKEAGFLAGFTNVVLLQEPIAACLAYSNLNSLNIIEEKKWIVYDFGGGTFDVALISIDNRALKVIDNKGNNFLGGVDIDYAIIEKIFVPKLASILNDNSLWANLIRKEGLYAKFWHYLIYIAEEAKKQLSMTSSCWVELDFPDMDVLLEFELHRNEFDRVVDVKYKESEKFVFQLLNDNGLTFNNIERIILIGGTTYIPLIKDSLRAVSECIIDDSIDPTTAVAAGAAYYAGSLPKADIPTLKGSSDSKEKVLEVKLSFETYSNDEEELIAFKTFTPFKGFYRITRTDGGYDSGMKEFISTSSEFVNLLPKSVNKFNLFIYDVKKAAIFTENDILISQGLYSVSGQVLPNDICIELDNRDNETYLEVVFKKNAILPLTKTLYKTFSKSVTKGSDEKIIINLLEGKGGTLPSSNLSIGYIEISGHQLEMDLIEGTDIELQISINESRGLSVEIYIPSAEQEIKKTFNISQREVNIERLLQDIFTAEAIIEREIRLSNKDENFELSADFKNIELQLLNIKEQLKSIVDDHATEEKYRIDEEKRTLLKNLDDKTRARDVYRELKEFKSAKEEFLYQKDLANPFQIGQFEGILQREKELLQSQDKHLIKRLSNDLVLLNKQLFLQNKENFVGLFLRLKLIPIDNFKDKIQVKELFTMGDLAIQSKDYDQLKQLFAVIYSNITDEFKRSLTPSVKISKNTDISKTGLK